MANDETRYAKQKRIDEDKARHTGRVQKLATSTEDAFIEFVEKNRPPCVTGGLPSPWTDWATDPELREDYETEAPTKEEAEAMCAECPIRAVDLGGNGLCKAYAQATNQGHGVWGGRAREMRVPADGNRAQPVWLYDKAAHTAKGGQQ